MEFTNDEIMLLKLFVRKEVNNIRGIISEYGESEGRNRVLKVRLDLLEKLEDMEEKE